MRFIPFQSRSLYLPKGKDGKTNEPVLVFQANDFNSMKEHLLQQDGLERVSYVLFGVRGDDPFEELYVHKVINLDDSQYDRQEPSYVLPKMDVVLKMFNGFERSVVSGFMHVHCHPFCNNAEFSPKDDQSARKAVRSLGDYLAAGGVKGNFLFGRMVVGQAEAGFSAYIHDKAFNVKGEVHKLKVVGPAGIRKINRFTDSIADDVEITDRELLDRNIRWLGDEGQKLLSDSHVVICGVGGAGSLVALNMRGLGLRKITLIDHDRIEKSNLNRLPGATLKDVNCYKVNVIKRMIEDVSPTTDVEVIAERVQGDNAAKAISSGDVIISAVDSFSTRFHIQLLAARYLRPLIDIGAGITLGPGGNTVKSMGGQVVAYVPGGPCLCCQGVVPREIESELSTEVRKATGYVKGRDMTPTAVATINSVMAGHAVDMLIKFLTGFSEINNYLRCDMLTNTYQTFNFGKRPDCLLCGEEGVEGRGDETEYIIVPADGWKKERACRE